MARNELTDKQKQSLALKMLTRAEGTLANARYGRRDTALGEFLKDMAKYHNEILSDGSRCLSENEIRDAAVRACKRNELDRDVANGGLAKVEKDVPRCLAANTDLRVDDWTERFDKTANGTNYQAVSFDLDELTEVSALAFTELEDGFWAARQSLTDIYIGALSKMCSPWAVLAFCAARALALVRPHIVLPDVIGGPGSLNWFAAIAATSGGGKGAASATAKMLVPNPVQQRNTGSGEGMIRAYVRPKTDTEPAGLYESIMFVADEIDSLAAQTKRSGTTTMPVLRSAFSGETLGFAYLTNNTTIEAHTYRMTMVVSVQPARAGSLLDDEGGGTPQRFMWFPGTDTRITKDLAGEFVTPLTLPNLVDWQYPKTLRIPEVARELILDTRVKAMQGQQAALDGHALFVREKFAFSLALLDGRTEMSLEDWELSGIAAKVSDNTRDWVARAKVEADEEESVKRGIQQGISAAAASASKNLAEWERTNRIRAWVIAQLKTAGAEGVTQGRLRRDADKKVRHEIVSSLYLLKSNGVVDKIDRLDGDRSDRWALAN